MSKKEIQQIEKKIEIVKKKIQTIDTMRPGSLTKQYRDRATRTAPFWQLNYTRHNKSKSELIRDEWVSETQKQIETHKQFKLLIDQWIGLSIDLSKLTMKTEKLKKKK